MATIKLRISQTINERTEEGELLLRFCGGRDFLLRCRTRIFIKKFQWDDIKGKVILPRYLSGDAEERHKINKKLEYMQRFIFDSFDLVRDETPTSEWLQEVVDRFHEGGVVKAERYVEYISSLFNRYLDDAKIGEARQKQIIVCFNALLRYEEYKGLNLKPKDITPSFLASFEQFYTKEPSKQKRTYTERGQNTVSSKMKMLRAFIYWAIKKKYIAKNPFTEYTIPQELYGTPYYITIEERNTIYNHDFSKRPHIAPQRDIFVFQCLVGCRVGDLTKLSKNNVFDGALEYVANKTISHKADTIKVPLHKIALEIIERYKDDKSDKLLPFISPQKYNSTLKIIFKEVGITRVVTIINPLTGLSQRRHINELASSHMARRCFIGNLYKKVKDPNLIGSLSGHVEGSKAFARYREIDEDIKRELIDMLE